MSLRAMTYVLRHADAVGANRLVLLSIAEHAKDHGGDSYPSLQTIANEAKTNKRTAQRAIRSLAESGELIVSEATGPHGVNRYRIPIPKGWQHTAPRGVTPPATDRPGGSDAATEVDETPPPVASRPARGGVTPPEPSLNHPTTTSAELPNETFSASPVGSEPNCTRHPLGDGGVACGGCRARRLWMDRNEIDAKDAARRLREHCEECHGSGWLEDPETREPAGRCTACRPTTRRTA